MFSMNMEQQRVEKLETGILIGESLSLSFTGTMNTIEDEFSHTDYQHANEFFKSL